MCRARANERAKERLNRAPTRFLSFFFPLFFLCLISEFLDLRCVASDDRGTYDPRQAPPPPPSLSITATTTATKDHGHDHDHYESHDSEPAILPYTTIVSPGASLSSTTIIINDYRPLVLIPYCLYPIFSSSAALPPLRPATRNRAAVASYNPSQ